MTRLCMSLTDSAQVSTYTGPGKGRGELLRHANTVLPIKKYTELLIYYPL